MTWQGVPWAVSGATHPHEVARLLAHIASGGREGVATPQACAVRASEVPDGDVRIMPGGLSVLNRAVGGEQQNYVARNADEDVVAMPAAGGVLRYDMVAVLVEDPQYPGQPAPADVPDGPYVRSVVYTDVGTTAETLEDVDPGQTGYALARIERAAGTSTITNADITDLRDLVAPRTYTLQRMLNLPPGAGDEVLSTAGFSNFPNDAVWLGELIPEWASRVQLELHVAGVQLTDEGADGGTWSGQAILALGALETAPTELKPPDAFGTNKWATFGYIAADELEVPRAMRGGHWDFRSRALKGSSTGLLKVKAGWGTTVIAKATFVEAPDPTWWEQ